MNMENPLVSVIVPTKNSSRTLEACLASIKKQSYSGVEIVVVDNESTDNTKEIARKYTEKVFNKGPERSAQRNYGVAQCEGDFVLIIDSDMVLSEKVVESCIDKMSSDENILGLVVPEESFGEGIWAQCKKLERSFYVGVNWMEAARFFRRSIFDQMGGYDEKNTGTEDYDLPQRIQAEYGEGSINRVDDLIYHDEGRIDLFKTCKKKFYYAQKLDVYKEKGQNAENFKKQSSFLSRYMLFFSNPAKLFKNPFIGFLMLFMKTCELAFGGFGFIKSKIFN